MAPVTGPMGVDLGAILGHQLDAAGVRALPQRLPPDAAPGLARAIAQFARVRNERAAMTEQAHPEWGPQRRWPERGAWKYIEAARPIFLDEQGREVPPPDPPWDRLARGEHWRVPSPSAFRPIGPDELWAEGNGATVESEADLHLGLGRRAGVLRPIMRWGLFLTDQRLQLAFRRVCYELARLLDSPAAVYAPDSAWAASLAYDLPYEGYTLQEIIARLGERHGPPAPSIGAIYTVLDDGGTWRGDGYFVDTFADLAREVGV